MWWWCGACSRPRAAFIAVERQWGEQGVAVAMAVSRRTRGRAVVRVFGRGRAQEAQTRRQRVEGDVAHVVGVGDGLGGRWSGRGGRF